MLKEAKRFSVRCVNVNILYMIRQYRRSYNADENGEVRKNKTHAVGHRTKIRMPAV